MIHNRTLLLAALVLVHFGSETARAGGEIKLMSAVSVYHEMLSRIVPTFEKKTGIKVKYLYDTDKKVLGSPFSMEKLLEGEPDACIAAIGFEGWIKAYKEAKKGEAKPTNKITHRVIGKELIRVISHKGVGISKLSIEQVADLFTGKKKNWKEVGGKDIPASVFVQDSAISRVKVFRDRVLNGESFVSGYKAIQASNELKKAVATTEGAVSFFPDAQILPNDDVTEMTTEEEIGRPITLITIGKPKDDVLQLIHFIETEGKTLRSNH